MKHVLSYQLFESQNSYTLEDVRALLAYQQLLSLGWRDATTKIQERNKTLRLEPPPSIPEWPYTIHSNGYVRAQTVDRGQMKRKFEPFEKVADWEQGFTYVFYRTLKALGYKPGKIPPRLEEDKLVQLLIDMYQKSPKIFEDLYKLIGAEARMKVADALGQSEEELLRVSNMRGNVQDLLKWMV